MVERTDNHNLDVNHQVGDSWDYNDEMQRIEERLIVRDTEANRTNHTAHDGALFIATDTGAEYDGDGTSWNDADRKFNSLQVSKTPTKPADAARLDDVQSIPWEPEDWNTIDASDYGYPGDMSGGDIMDLFRNHPNSVFILPEGRYAIQSELNLESTTDWERLAIIGKPHATLVVDDPAVTRTFRVGSTADPFPIQRMENLTLEIDPANNLDAGWGRFRISDYVENKNLRLSGRRDRVNTTDPGDRFSYFCEIVDESGSGIHQNIKLPDGDTPDGSLTQQDHTVAFGAESPHVGDQKWINCYAEEYVDNGFYVKDGTGSNILEGCYTRNCGGAGIRLGESDVADACGGVWDATSGNPIFDAGFFGTILDADAASGTAVNGFRAIKSSGDNEAVRIRDVSEQATYRDLYIDNSTSQWALRVSSSGGTHDDGVLSIDNARIVDTGDTSVRSAAVRVERPNVHLSDVSIDTTGGGTSRTALDVFEGSARVDGMSILKPAASYAVVLGDSSGTTISRALFDGARIDGGLYAYSSASTIESVHLVDCDLRNMGSLFDNGTRSEIGTVVTRDNDGLASDTSGTSTQSGDGATTDFTIAHGCYDTPSRVNVTPATPSAQADHTITVDATNITISFSAAPASGTDNLKWHWEAEV